MKDTTKEMSSQGETYRVVWGAQRFFLSMGWKTLIAFALVVFIPMGGLLLLTSSTLRSAMEDEALHALEANLRGAWRVYHQRSDSLRDALMLSASTPSVQRAVREREKSSLTDLLNRNAALFPFADVWLVLDEHQHIVARRHGPTGQPVSLNNVVTRAFAFNKPVVSTELLTNHLFLDENAFEFSGLDTEVIVQTIVVPIHSAGKLVGGFAAVILLNNDNWLPNSIHDYLSIEAALFASVIQESRIVAASERPNNIWASGLLAPTLLNQAIRQGQIYRGELAINDVRSFVIAEPIFNLENIPVGALTIGVHRSNIDKLIAETSRHIYFFILIGILLSLVIAYLAYRDTMTPMRALMGAMDAFARGDLAARTELRTKDEFEEMGSGFNRMAAAVQEQHDRVESFSSLAGLLISSRHPEELLQRALDQLVHLSGAQCGAIYLTDHTTDTQRLVPFVSYALDKARMPSVDFGQGLPGQAAQSRQPIHLTRPSDECRIVINFGTAESLPNEITFFPLIYRDQVLGLLLLATLGRFHPSEISTLEYSTNQIAIVLENVLTHSKLERLSITDELTQVFNRRYLTQKLAAEFAESERYGSPFSVLLLDIDRFKLINDRHGHHAGDEALRAVASVLKQQVREVDVVGRYGGEEFLVLLPQTSLADASVVAEKIRYAIETHGVPSLSGLHVTVSIGLAGLPDGRATTPDQLVGLADRALYQAKDNGRNQVVSSLEAA